MIAKIMTALKFLYSKPFISCSRNRTRRETHKKHQIQQNKSIISIEGKFEKFWKGGENL